MAMTEEQALEVARETLEDAMAEYRDAPDADYRVELMDSTANEMAYNITDDDDPDVDVIAIFRIELG